MDIFASIGTWGGWLTGYVVPFLFVLTIVVFFHELGHFLIARWCGVRVVTFSIGFGPELLGFNDRHGTRWKLAAIPLGGYVKFFGDENAASVPDSETIGHMSEEERRESFFFKPVSQRAAIVAAGPIANFLLAIVIFAGVFTFYGKQAAPARVETVQPNSAAAGAGFKPSDLIVSINGRKIETFTDMQRIVSASAGQPLEIEIDRGGMRIDAQGDAGAHRDQGQFRQRASHRRAWHYRCTWRAGQGRSRNGAQARGGGDVVRGRTHALLHRGRGRR